MLKEGLISGYLLLFRLIFTVFKLCPQKQKVTYIASFEENALYLHQEMERQNKPFDMILLCKPALSKSFQVKLHNTPIIPFETPNIISWCKGIYHLATSQIVIIDNYYAFLSSITFKDNVECIQIWHAVGALKKFGLEDKSIIYRNKAALKRFKNVYKNFHKVVVGSEAMAKIFMASFGLPKENILRIGIPRTDLFFDQKVQVELEASFDNNYPLFSDKKTILYAPTYRDTQLHQYDIQLDIDKMYHELKDEFVLLIKLHPAVKTNQNYQEMYPDFVYDFSAYKGINEILVIVDFLITDYSSIPFEYSLLGKPMIFFPYDLDLYQKERGIPKNYIQDLPGPVVFETDEIIQIIKSNQFDLDIIKKFSHQWNEYSMGNSSEKLIQYIENQFR